MLRELRSAVLRTGTVLFHDGLNVVLGDENATNSIGKSTLLMLVDFAFGGSTLLEHNKDLVTELGHHDYFFRFQFDDETSWFRRGTSEPDVLHVCDELLEPVRTMDLDEFTAYLAQSYAISLDDLSFRAAISLYLRVWGKDNLAVDRPLHTVQAQSASECVDTLVKLFGRYGELREQASQLGGVENQRSALRKAARLQIVPKVGKREYTASKERLESLEAQLVDIKVHLAKYATSLSELVNRDVLELKQQKDALIQQKYLLTSRQQRVDKSLSESRYIKSKHFADLVRFFPEMRTDRLTEVEEFHNGVARLLKTELKESSKTLRAQVASLDTSLSEIDQRMSRALGQIKEPTSLVDKVVDVAYGIRDAHAKTETYEKEQALVTRIADLRTALAATKERIYAHVSKVINDGMRRTVTAVFGGDRKSPQLMLGDGSYTFEVFEDTGTGAAYASVIILDLTVFSSTPLPAVAHDSLMFKNIENASVAKLLAIYQKSQKQSFIAIDEAEKYGSDTAQLLRALSVVRLDNDNLLFVKDWRTKE